MRKLILTSGEEMEVGITVPLGTLSVDGLIVGVVDETINEDSIPAMQQMFVTRENFLVLIDGLIASGLKIQAIKLVREATKSSLREATGFVNKRVSGKKTGQTA